MDRIFLNELILKFLDSLDGESRNWVYGEFAGLAGIAWQTRAKKSEDYIGPVRQFVYPDGGYAFGAAVVSAGILDFVLSEKRAFESSADLIALAEDTDDLKMKAQLEAAAAAQDETVIKLRQAIEKWSELRSGDLSYSSFHPD